MCIWNDTPVSLVQYIYIIIYPVYNGLSEMQKIVDTKHVTSLLLIIIIED